ncbi:HDIG domain-containing protein [candidate division KSB1 bacterium]|nr:HDIG domain-containing protein [candidate division KSB1 bacterium]
MISRDEALDLVQKHIKNKNLQKHMLATEAVMCELAVHFHEDVEVWGLAGLLHDLDYDKTVKDFSKHGFITVEILADKDVPEAILQAIKSHPGHVERESLMDKALYAADPVTGLIVAAALMHPSKKLKFVNTEFIERRYKEKRFAAGANREQIQSCETMNLSLHDFIELSLKAMQSIDKDLGL